MLPPKEKAGEYVPAIAVKNREQKAGVIMQKDRQRKPGLSLFRGVSRFLLVLGTIWFSLYLFALGVGLLMRLKPVDELARRFSKKYEPLFNKIGGTRVGSLYFSIGNIKHVGRKSGREFVTTISAYPLADGFVFALAYPDTDWRRNIMASGKCTLTWKGQVYELERPEVLSLSEALPAYSLFARPFIAAGGTSQFLWLHKKRSAVPEQEKVLVGE